MVLDKCSYLHLTAICRSPSSTLTELLDHAPFFPRYPIKWRVIEENNLMDDKIRNWLNKKVADLYDQEETAVVDHILQVLKRVSKGTMTVNDMIANLEQFLGRI